MSSPEPSRKEFFATFHVNDKGGGKDHREFRFSATQTGPAEHCVVTVHCDDSGHRSVTLMGPGTVDAPDFGDDRVKVTGTLTWEQPLHSPDPRFRTTVITFAGTLHTEHSTKVTTAPVCILMWA
jgi:hypothetical protein